MKVKEENKVALRFKKNVTKLNVDYKLIEEGDKVMVCLSGGKDSYTLLNLLLDMQKESAFYV